MAKDAEASLIIKIKEIGSESLKKIDNSLSDIKEKAALASAAFLGFLGVSIKSYEEAEQAANVLTAALKSQGLNVDELTAKYGEYAAAIQKKTTYGDDELIQALALAQSLAGNLELTEDLIKSTVNFAAATGQDLKSAFSVVGKSIGGSTNAVGRYRFELSDSMTAQEKMTVITADLTKKFDGFAEAQADGLGSIKQMTNALGDIFEVIGEQLAPHVSKLAKLITNLAQKLQDKEFATFAAVIATIGAAATGLVAVLGTVAASLGPISAGLALLAGPTGWILLAATAVAALGTAWATNFGDIQSTTFGVIEALKTLFVGFVGNIGDLFSDFGSLLKGVFTFDIDEIKSSIQSIKDTSQKVIDQTVEAYKIGFSERTRSLETTIKQEEKTEKKSALAVTAEKIKQNAKVNEEREKNAEKIVELESQLEEQKLADARAKQKEYLDLEQKEFQQRMKEQYEAEEKLAKDHQQFLQDVGSYTTDFLKSGIQGVTQSLVQNMTETFLPGFGGAAGQAFAILSQDAEQFEKTLEQLFSVKFIENIAENIPKFVEYFADNIPEIVTTLVREVIAAAPDIAIAFAKAFDDPHFYAALIEGVYIGVRDGVEEALLTVRDAIKDAFSDLTSVKIGGKKIFNSGGIVPAYASGGIIPRLASGGVVDNQLALLRPGEAVIPTETVRNNPQAVGALLAGRSPDGGGGGVVVNIHSYGGMLGNEAEARKFAAAIDKELYKLRRDKSSIAFDSAVF